jgi:hypothetical protein
MRLKGRREGPLTGRMSSQDHSWQLAAPASCTCCELRPSVWPVGVGSGVGSSLSSSSSSSTSLCCLYLVSHQPPEYSRCKLQVGGPCGQGTSWGWCAWPLEIWDRVLSLSLSLSLAALDTPGPECCAGRHPGCPFTVYGPSVGQRGILRSIHLLSCTFVLSIAVLSRCSSTSSSTPCQILPPRHVQLTQPGFTRRASPRSDHHLKQAKEISEERQEKIRGPAAHDIPDPPADRCLCSGSGPSLSSNCNLPPCQHHRVGVYKRSSRCCR